MDVLVTDERTAIALARAIRYNDQEAIAALAVDLDRTALVNRLVRLLGEAVQVIADEKDIDEEQCWDLWQRRVVERSLT